MITSFIASLITLQPLAPDHSQTKPDDGMRNMSNEIAWIKINPTGSIADVITIWFGGSKLSGDRHVSAEVVDYHIWQGKLLE